MNENFYKLPAEKQQRIINAGFHVFSRNSYRKSPMQEIADTAGISKSLLFHYFKNKQELYLCLWDRSAKITVDYLTRNNCYDSTDLFEMMERGMRAKIQMMKEYPDMSTFAIKAFYEKDSAVIGGIQNSYYTALQMKAAGALSKVNPDDFIPGLNLKWMYREMYLAALGYLWELAQWDMELDVTVMETDFLKMLDFWKSVYLRKEASDETACD